MTDCRKGHVVGSGLRSGAVLVVFLLSIGAGCAPTAGIGDYQRQKTVQKNAAAEIQAVGGKVSEVKRPQGISWAVNLSGAQLSDELFDSLKQLGYISELNLSKTNVTDAQMEWINEKEIGAVVVKLDLSNTAVSDAGLAKLTDLLVLMDLNLAGTKVTPAGVANFKQHRANDSRIWGLFKNTAVRLH
jgi:hypothetical protein